MKKILLGAILMVGACDAWKAPSYHQDRNTFSAAENNQAFIEEDGSIRGRLSLANGAKDSAFALLEEVVKREVDVDPKKLNVTIIYSRLFSDEVISVYKEVGIISEVKDEFGKKIDNEYEYIIIPKHPAPRQSTRVIFDNIEFDIVDLAGNKATKEVAFDGTPHVYPMNPADAKDKVEITLSRTKNTINIGLKLIISGVEYEGKGSIKKKVNEKIGKIEVETSESCSAYVDITEFDGNLYADVHYSVLGGSYPEPRASSPVFAMAEFFAGCGAETTDIPYPSPTMLADPEPGYFTGCYSYEISYLEDAPLEGASMAVVNDICNVTVNWKITITPDAQTL